VLFNIVLIAWDYHKIFDFRHNVILWLHGLLSIIASILLFFFGTPEVVNRFYFGLGPNKKLKLKFDTRPERLELAY
jgi:hypothetical protein